MPQPSQGALFVVTALCVGPPHVPTTKPLSFAQRFSIRVERGADDGYEACYLQSVHRDRSISITEFFTLGRQIIAGKARCGKTLLLYQELGYIPLYWELTERVLACFGTHLRDCSLYQAVYASLYSYSRDAHVLRDFCESWCPTTNTLHTLS